MKLTTLTFNLQNTAIRRETLQGREYLVAPMAMLTEGVHAGSGGPLLYKEQDCKKAVPAWNMKPVVVYHPQINGQGISACDPTVLETQQVGMVMNTKWNGKLRAEAWIDEKLAANVDARVLDALEENKMMEVSTGLFTDNVPEPGDWNGEPYDAIATNHQPDHLALLPDKIGACSIADGAGLLQLNEAAQAAGVDITRALAREMDSMRRLVGNAMSHNDIWGKLSTAIMEANPSTDKDKPMNVWLVDVYPKHAVYEKEGKLYRIGYTKGKRKVELSGEPVEVTRVTEYRPVGGDIVGNQTPTQTQPKESDDMEKEQIVNDLIANADTPWGEEDREALMGMEDAVLNKMGMKKKGKKKKMDDEEEETVENTAAPASDDDAPQTMDEYIANAPAEMQDVLRNGVAAHNAQKAALIATITGNELNTFSEEFLQTKGLQELQGLAALCPAKEETKTDAPVPMFNGAATPPAAPAPTNNEDAAEEGLILPVMNFAPDAE